MLIIGKPRIIQQKYFTGEISAGFKVLGVDNKIFIPEVFISPYSLIYFGITYKSMKDMFHLYTGNCTLLR